MGCVDDNGNRYERHPDVIVNPTGPFDKSETARKLKSIPPHKITSLVYRKRLVKSNGNFSLVDTPKGPPPRQPKGKVSNNHSIDDNYVTPVDEYVDLMSLYSEHRSARWLYGGHKYRLME